MICPCLIVIILRPFSHLSVTYRV